VQPRPHRCEIFELVAKRFAARREIRGIDAAGGDAGQDVWNEAGTLTGEIAKDADLIRRTRAAAAEN
jgi:hypothetical protein